MATHTLTADTIISTLMPSGGGSLASGDTIQLAGHSLIVDADAVNYPVTIANRGGECNLELRDLGRIKLNATLPATVHPYVDPALPLPVSAEPGVDGDPYRTNLTANARAEIQLAGEFPLGGGAAALPTETRAGGFWAIANSRPSDTSFILDRDIPIHVGDIIYPMIPQPNTLNWRTVTAYDSTTQTVTLNSAPAQYSDGIAFGVIAGGVVLQSPRIKSGFSAPVSGGTINFVSDNNGNYFTSASVVAKRCGFCCWWGFSYVSYDYNSQFAQNSASVKADEIVCPVFALGSGEMFDVGELVCVIPFQNRMIGGTVGKIIAYRCGVVNSSGFGSLSRKNYSTDTANGILKCREIITTNKSPSVENQSKYAIVNGGHTIELGGTVTESSGNFYHAPATAADVTWRYADRTVPAGATLRLNCAWLREGPAATRASVAITDTATWWPSLWPLGADALWPLGADALASVEFTGGPADWLQQLLMWRNTGMEAATVRVWECVTGSTGGGYLKTQEVKGGAL